MTMKFATIAIQDFASITLIGRVEHGAGCEALDWGQLNAESYANRANAREPKKTGLKDQKFLLFLDLAGTAAAFTVGCDDCGLVALVGACPCIGITGFDIDKCLFAQLGEIGARRG